MKTKSVCDTTRQHNDHRNESFCKTFDNAQFKQRTESKEKLNGKKYFQYFAAGGWGNQVNCLILGYWFALATGRVLIVPPIIPRDQANQLIYTFIIDQGVSDMTYAKSLLYSSDLIRIIYAEQKPTKSMVGKLKCKYTERMNYTKPFFNYTSADLLSLGKVLDLDYMLPNIEKIDLHEFYARHWTESMSHWVMNYTHSNTIFLRNQPHLENTSRKKRKRTYTYRDISTIGRQYNQFNVWTLYDTFDIGFRGGVHHSVFEHHTSIFEYKIRFTEPVRVAARAAHEKIGCIPYVAVHIRATEQVFQQQLPLSINTSMEEAINSATSWLGKADKTPETIGLFILTDWPRLIEHPLFEEKLLKMKNHVFAFHKTELLLLAEEGDAISGYSDIVMQLGKSIGVGNRKASFFLAQQIAACGSIGFFGTQGSTFSLMVKNIRESACAC